ncbi:LamG domain-containing protein [Larkinella soli]|uniref:LamG domain-containing protein n=1 Tax=Larkinella soli TaxID=1770527 RepID=UPI000FFCAF4B|nr:LamG domain-containing protein [Larkinella soli]
MKVCISDQPPSRLCAWLLTVIAVSACESWDPPRREFSTQNLSNGLVAYYPFNGNPEDVSGNNFHGAFGREARTGPDRSQKANAALWLDGIDDSFEVADRAALRPPALSISLWICPRSLTSTSHIYYKASYIDNQNQMFSAKLRPLTGSGYDLIADVRQDGFCDRTEAYTEVKYSTSTPLAMNQWHHLTTVFSGKSGKVYLDGVLVRSLDSLPDAPIDNCPGSDLHFGVAHAGDVNAFNGGLDEIRIYNRALSEAEIQALMRL